MIPATSDAALRIVVVEDYYPLQGEIIRSLKAPFSNAQVEGISTEWEFTRRFDEIAASAPTLIVLDLRLRWRDTDDTDAPAPAGSPDGAGLRLLERRAAHPSLRQVPIIIKSAFLTDATRSLVEDRFDGVYFPKRDDLNSIVALACSLIAATVSFSPSSRPNRTPQTGRILNRVFISYSRQDRNWADRMREALLPYCTAGVLQLWDDCDLTAGRWEQQIETEMNTAGIAVFLVTTGFCTSEFIQKRELPELIDAHDRDDVKIFWVAVSHSAVDTTALARFQCLNDPRRPLDMLPKKGDRTKALTEIARAIAESLQT